MNFSDTQQFRTTGCRVTTLKHGKIKSMQFYQQINGYDVWVTVERPHSFDESTGVMWIAG